MKLSDPIRKSHVRVTGTVHQTEEGAEILLKEVTEENFPSLWEELDFRIAEANGHLINCINAEGLLQDSFYSNCQKLTKNS